ncbi:MAG: YncE family protein [Gemmatimonadales bacterium]
MKTSFKMLACALALLPIAAATAQAQSYHVAHTYILGGDGGWDYVALDTEGNRLFIARQDRVMVVDASSGKLLGEIPGFNRAHGVAFSYATGKGFATSGGDSSVIEFDLKTLKVLDRIPAAPDADAILYDPATKHIFTFNGDAHSSTVIDPVTGKRIGTVDLGAKPEFGVSAGDGKLYVNLEEISAVAEVDAATMKVTRQWSITPCVSPSGLAIDRAHHRLFSVCRNGKMTISDAVAGVVVATVPIGQGVDAARFDDGTQFAFASNGDGTLTVVHEDSPSAFRVVENDSTQRGARTMEVDLRDHRVFTVTAKFGPAPAPEAGRRSRPPVLPGSFALLVLER